MAPREKGEKKGKAAVRSTANFEAGLSVVEEYLHDVGADDAFARLIDELVEVVVPNLERFPEVGRLFDERPVDSAEAATRLRKIRKALGRVGDGARLREYLFGDLLILYAACGATVHLLAIRHHRQIAFDIEKELLR